MPRIPESNRVVPIRPSDVTTPVGLAIAPLAQTGRALAVAGLHPATGGSGLELCSGDMLLEALVAWTKICGDAS